MKPETRYMFEFDRYLHAIRDIKAPISDYREALSNAIDQLEEELESLGDPDDDDTDTDEGDSR